MPKKIVICCDGTANEFAQDRTNVLKLYSALVHDTPDQVAYYHPGIGTMEPFGALSSFTRFFTRILGMAIGYGLENDIRDAYIFLMKTYRPGDSVYLFGFSRGAFTVRAVASLVYMYGVIREDNETLVPYAIRMLMGIQRAGSDKKAAKAYFDLAAEFKRTMSCARPRMRFVGIWDTVSSVGWIENPLHLPYEANNPDIEVGRHAVSIDEHRAFFRSHLWQTPKTFVANSGPHDIQQVWFPGVHCDVGGGFPESESGLSKFALEWMIEEATSAGLLVDNDKAAEVLGISDPDKYAPAKASAQMHESLRGAWNIAEFIPKRHWNAKAEKWGHRMNLYRRRPIPPNSMVHDAAYLRDAAYRTRIPSDALRVYNRGTLDTAQPANPAPVSGLALGTAVGAASPSPSKSELPPTGS